MATQTHRTIDAVWRIESAPHRRPHPDRARRRVAEDLAQDALVAALEKWPTAGVPDNPGAWLMATAKHRAIDLLRRAQMLERKHQEVGYEMDARQELAVPDLHAAIDDDIGDATRPWLPPFGARARRGSTGPVRPTRYRAR
ncbi:MAG: hypothetical protein H0X07_12845 [Gemmatimonadales bacterium]|nr:hypothetical protein [Gemmatimonadales bacterium]